MKKYSLITILALVVLVAVIFGFNSNRQTNQSPSSTASPSASGREPNYKDQLYGYQIYIPDNFELQRQNENSVLFVPKQEPGGVGPTNFVYVSVIPPEMKNSVGEIYNYSQKDFEKLLTLNQVGESVNLSDNSDLAKWYEYTLVAYEDFPNARVKNFENNTPWEFPSGTTENRFIYDSGVNVYLLGYYTGGDSGTSIDPRIAYEIIKSFRPSELQN